MKKGALMKNGALHTVRDLDRFMRKVDIIPGGCWEWRGAKQPSGYGAFGFGHANMHRAHRLSYAYHYGMIPQLGLDHLCKNRSCVNPRHLEPVTQKTNILRGRSFAAINAVKTHCVNGHAFTPDNTTIRQNGRRRCLACQRAYDKGRWRSGPMAARSAE